VESLVEFGSQHLEAKKAAFERLLLIKSLSLGAEWSLPPVQNAPAYRTVAKP
jgi:hypothetical protein